MNCGGRVATWSPFDHLDPFAYAERPQLIDRCCAEGICSNEQR